MNTNLQSLWMLFAAFIFAFMGVCIKLASSLYSTSEIMMYRGIIGMIFLFLFIKSSGGTFRTPLPWQHLWRGVVGVTAMWLWMFSISLLPLATAMTLNYMAPIWIAAILFIGGWWRRQNRLEWGMAAAIMMSFIGVAALLRPSIHADQLVGGIIGLISGLLASLALLQVRHLGQMGEPEYRVVFYFSVTSTFGGLLCSVVNGSMGGGRAVIWHAHNGTGIALLLTIGVCATVAQIAMTRAYRLGKVLVTANLQYTGIIFSSIWGVIIWGDTLNWLGWLGIAIILISGLTATYYNTRNAKPADGKLSLETATDPIMTEL